MSNPTEQAADPRTPASELARLAASRDPSQRRLVASNPAVPADVLRSLAHEFPDEVLENASLPLHLLEDPSFFSRLDSRSSDKLLRSPRATPELSEQLAEHPIDFVRISVARASITPLEVLERLARNASVYVISAVAQNPKFPLASLHALLLHPSEAVTVAVLSSGRIDHVWLPLLAESVHPTVRAQVATRTQDPALLGSMARDPERIVRLSVVRNPHTPRPVLGWMRRDQDENIRTALVDHPSTTRFTLLTLLRDPTRPARLAASVKLQAPWQPA
jgi:hypothetical protein